MTDSLRSIIDAGTKLWLDTIHPDEVDKNRRRGISGATSNPKIISDLVASGRVDEAVRELAGQYSDDAELAWHLADRLVTETEQVFRPVWDQSEGDDGYVSFELDPLLEDPKEGPSHDQAVSRYIALAERWAENHPNRMIKVPATPAGIEALEGIAARGIAPNVTLIFTPRQYRAARDAIWRGAQQHGNLQRFKSVYSIFISRVDVYTEKHLPSLSKNAQGMVGLLNAKRIWRENAAFWADQNLPLRQEMVFASTGVKQEGTPADYYVEALVGGDIQTNPPETLEAVVASGKSYERAIETLPSDEVCAEIDEKVDLDELERVLVEEGIKKFADPQRELLETLKNKRKETIGA